MKRSAVPSEKASKPPVPDGVPKKRSAAKEAELQMVLPMPSPVEAIAKKKGPSERAKATKPEKAAKSVAPVPTVEGPAAKTAAAKRPVIKKSGPRVKPGVELFVCRSGPRRGDAQLQAAFRTRREAVAFLANVHGLVSEEQKALNQKGKLQLDFRQHGSEICAIQAVKLPPSEIDRALSGDLYL